MATLGLGLMRLPLKSNDPTDIDFDSSAKWLMNSCLQDSITSIRVMFITTARVKMQSNNASRVDILAKNSF